MTWSTCWNKVQNLLKKRSYRTAWTHLWITALTGVDLEPISKRRANRTEVLVSLYLLSRSLHIREPSNQIPHQSTKIKTLLDCLKLEKGFTKSPNPMLFNISKQTFPKTQGQQMRMTGIISRVVTPKEKTNWNPLATLKVWIFSRSAVSSSLSQCL